MMGEMLDKTVCLTTMNNDPLLSMLVRVSAKELTSLILDEERLRQERSDRRTWKSRVTGIEDYGPAGGSNDYPTGRRNDRGDRNERRGQRHTDDDDNDEELKVALEISKNEMEADKKRRESRANTSADDEDLAKAIKLSKEEEELRRKELEDSNANSLFDLNSPSSSSQQPQYTGYNQGYQQQGAVDWFGNPVDQQPQQAQTTGFLNNAYSQGFPTQQTGFQNGFQFQQQTGFDPSQFQQQQANYLQPQQTIQPQQTAFNSVNPYAQSNDFSQFQQQQQQQVASPTAGSHNPWAQQQSNQTDALKPMPTGSNNPFASSFTKQQAQRQQQRPGPPTLNTLSEQQITTHFNNNQSSYNPISNYSAPQQIQQQTAQQPRETDPNKARLNALLASGEGMDTFGNTGDLRIPAQHTAPGTFVNSAGQNLNKLHATQTGNNPFFTQQFTGAPQQASGAWAGQQSSMMPVQTGPAGVQSFGGSPFGQASNNPFGSQQRQQNPGGSLIDL